jgi:hypothetical protein
MRVTLGKNYFQRSSASLADMLTCLSHNPDFIPHLLSTPPLQYPIQRPMYGNQSILWGDEPSQRLTKIEET